MAKTEIDWITVKSEYVTTLQTLLELSEKYGISMGSLEKTSANEHWVDERRNYREIVEKRVEENIGIKVAKDRAEQVKIGKSLQALGLKNLTSVVDGGIPKHELLNADDDVNAIRTGGAIVSANLPKTDRLEIIDSNATLRRIAESLQVTLDEEHEKEHKGYSEVS